jgi:hypothetical protein
MDMKAEFGNKRATELTTIVSWGTGTQQKNVS